MTMERFTRPNPERWEAEYTAGGWRMRTHGVKKPVYFADLYGIKSNEDAELIAQTPKMFQLIHFMAYRGDELTDSQFRDAMKKQALALMRDIGVIQ